MRNLILGLAWLLMLIPQLGQALPLTDRMATRKGDLDAMLSARQLRVLVVYDNANFFLHQGRQEGLNVSLMKQFERWLNERYFHDQKLLKMNVVLVPVRHDKLLPMLNAGQGDLVLANLSPTQMRRTQADFSIPEIAGVQEWLVSGNQVPAISRLTELSGKHIWVRRSSSYFESLQMLNDMLATLKMPPVYIEPADEVLQDSDLLDMVSRGEIPYTVVDSHKARLWQKVFNDLRFHDAVPLRRDSQIAWAFRKNSPQLEREVNAFLREYGADTRKGAPIYRNYLLNGSALLARHRGSGSSMMGWSSKEFQRYAPLFKRYGEQYSIDWMMLLAQAYQESTMNQSARSPRGAMGIMQVLPSTARALKVSGIGSLENNVHAGTKYMRHMMDTYFDDEALDEDNRVLFTLAAYNAGPNRIAQLRKEAIRRGLDGNVWFGNVERVAALRVGSETVQYVKNVSSRYVAYRRTYELSEQKKRLRPH
ncbi:MAG: transglycosylase SLT domain-containing protein [Aeromonadaceae bacterium]